MKLQSMLLSSPHPSSAFSAFADGSNNNFTDETTSTNLPPILNSYPSKKCIASISDTPNFLEPTPLIESYYFKKTFAMSIPFTNLARDLPPLSSSSSSCSSAPSTPSSPTVVMNHLEADFPPFIKNSAQTCNTDMQTAYFPRIKPKPNKEGQELPSHLKCPVAMDFTMDDSSLALSPTMLAASTAAVAASNLNYSRLTATKKSLDVAGGSYSEAVENNYQEKQTNFPDTNTFDGPAKCKHSDSSKRLTFNKNENRRIFQAHQTSAADRLMFLTKNSHIKRPRNAWIHFRCHYGQALKSKDPTLRAEEISKRASRRWALLNENEKKPWHRLAEQDKQAHKEAFPNYKYCPRRSNSAAIIARQNSASFHDKFDIAPDMGIDTNLENLAKRRLMK